MLFTFILTYNGFAYTRQIEGDTLTGAFQDWQDTTQRIAGEPLKVSLRDLLQGERLAPLKGMENVWACLFKIENRSVLLNVVKTVVTEQAREMVEAFDSE